MTHFTAPVLPILAEGAGGGMGSFLLPMVLVFLIFYFIVIRPSSRERKQREAQLSALKKHDRVVTNAGIHGVVVALEDDAVILRVDDKNNVRMKFSRAAIWQVLGAEEQSPTPVGKV
jgi:preprotein translocase subunit YajC